MGLAIIQILLFKLPQAVKNKFNMKENKVLSHSVRVEIFGSF